jgi:hypothetical protein
MRCYHLELMLSSGMKCYHLQLILSSGANVIIWDEMLSSRWKFYHLELKVIICDEILSFIIWDDNTPLFYFFWKLHSLFADWHTKKFAEIFVKVKKVCLFISVFFQKPLKLKPYLHYLHKCFYFIFLGCILKRTVNGKLLLVYLKILNNFQRWEMQSA